MGVPVIYGFFGRAAGPHRGDAAGRYFQPSAIAEVGSGRASPRLGYFATESMIAVSGLSEADPHSVYRREVCQYRRPVVAGG